MLRELQRTSEFFRFSSCALLSIPAWCSQQRSPAFWAPTLFLSVSPQSRASHRMSSLRGLAKFKEALPLRTVEVPGFDWQGPQKESASLAHLTLVLASWSILGPPARSPQATISHTLSSIFLQRECVCLSHSPSYFQKASLGGRKHHELNTDCDRLASEHIASYFVEKSVSFYT